MKADAFISHASANADIAETLVKALEADKLKAWIDSIVVAGKTFRYAENGVQGLVAGKRVIVASSRGGVYSTGPMASVDHQEAYLRDVLHFIGITDVTFVRAEGMGMGDEVRGLAIETALAEADALSARMEAVAA